MTFRPSAFLHFILFVFIVAAPALAQSDGLEYLEKKFQGKLEHILLPDEYVLDIKATGTDGKADDQNVHFLPGLQVLGPLSDINDAPNNLNDQNGLGRISGKMDILLILDKHVSKERAKVALDIVNRVVETEGYKASTVVTMQQKDIDKTPKDESKAADRNDEKDGKKSPDSPDHKDESLMSQMIREKDFIARALLVFWVGLVSMMGAYFALRRFLLGNSNNGGGSGIAGNSGFSARGAQEVVTQPAASSGGKEPKSERTREELYSRDQAILNSIKEITDEAKMQPEKVARILSRWVSKGDELARAASLFLRNCDIKTVELVCKAMHPSDLENVISHKIEDFEPFGSENQRVIERMRADFAVLAAEHFLRERPDPLNFLKRVSDDEIRNILEGESSEIIALVATQIPAHRLQKYFDSASSDTMKAVLAKLSSLTSASLDDFENLQLVLNHKIETLARNLVSEKDKIQSIHQMIVSTSSPSLQWELMERLRVDSPQVFSDVRPSVLLVPDLAYLSSRIKNLLIQSIEADRWGTVFSTFTVEVDEFADGLPPAFQSIMRDAMSKSHEPSVIQTAWKTIHNTMTEMLSGGLISKNEIAYTITKSETALAKNKEIQGKTGEGDSQHHGDEPSVEDQGAA